MGLLANTNKKKTGGGLLAKVSQPQPQPQYQMKAPIQINTIGGPTANSTQQVATPNTSKGLLGGISIASDILDVASGSVAFAPARITEYVQGKPFGSSGIPLRFSEGAMQAASGGGAVPDKFAKPLGIAVGLIGDPLNLIGGEGLKGIKGLSKVIAISEDATEIGNFLRHAGFEEDLIAPISKELVSVKDPLQVEKRLLNLEKLQNETRPVTAGPTTRAPSEQVVRDVPAVRPLPREPQLQTPRVISPETPNPVLSPLGRTIPQPEIKTIVPETAKGVEVSAPKFDEAVLQGSAIAKEPTVFSKIATTLRESMTSTLEYVQNTEQRVKELIERPNVKVTDETDPYLKMTLYSGKVGQRIEEGYIQARDIVNSLQEIAREHGTDLKSLRDSLNEFLISRHAPERNLALGEGAAGLTTAKATENLIRIKAEPYGKQLEKIAEKASDLNKQVLKTLQESGVISDELFDTLTKKYKQHVPLQRIFEGSEDIGSILSGRGFDVKGTGIRRAVGSERKVDDVMANIILNYEQAVLRAEKNIVDTATLGFVRANKKELEGLIEETKPKVLGTTSDGKPLFERTSDPRILQMYEKGKPVWLKINDKRLAVALRGIGREKLPGILRVVGAFTRFMAGLATRFNPEFALSNKLRDLQEVAVYLSSQKGVGGNAALKMTLKDPGSMRDVLAAIRYERSGGASIGRPFQRIEAQSLPSAGVSEPSSLTRKTALGKPGPSDSFSSRYIAPSTSKNFDTIDEYITTQRKIAQENLSPLVEELEQVTGVKPTSRIKDAEGFKDKIGRTEREGKSVDEINDVLGTRLTIDRGDVYDTINKVQEHFNTKKIKNYFATPTEWGYRGANVVIELPGGMLAEIQIHTKESAQFVDKIHDLYKKWINKDLSKLSPEEQAAMNADILKANKIADETFGDALTTNFIEYAKYKKTISRQEVMDFTKRKGIKKAESDLLMEGLKNFKGDKIPAQEFVDSISGELLPLEAMYRGAGGRYENITLPEELRGPVANYQERVYESPIKTSAGDVHFSAARGGTPENYFAHTRIEDLPATGQKGRIIPPRNMSPESTAAFNKRAEELAKGGSTRRVIELQSDLFQKGRLADEATNAGMGRLAGLHDAEDIIQRELTPEQYQQFIAKGGVTSEKKSAFLNSIRPGLADKIKNEVEGLANQAISAKQAELSKLEPYRNTWHERVIREEVKQAAKDGKTKLQFPTGETALRVEGLGDNSRWVHGEGNVRLNPDDLQVGAIIRESSDAGIHGGEFVVTKVYGDGKFQAIRRDTFEQFAEDTGKYPFPDDAIQALKDDTFPRSDIQTEVESFDISGKVDTENPIYKFYEKEVGKYLKNKYGAQLVTDPQGVKWWEVNINKGMAKEPIFAFEDAGVRVPELIKKPSKPNAVSTEGEAKPSISEGARLYLELKELGGTTGGFGLSTRKNVELDIKKLETLAQSKPRRFMERAIELVDEWNTIFEDSTRLSVYKQGLESGLTKERAAALAKEASINFNRMGTGGPVINALWMFSNASIQGSVKMIRSLKDPKTAAAVATIVGGSVAAVNEWNDTIDPEWRNKVSKWDRLNSLPIVMPNADGEGVSYISIPVSWGLKPIKVMSDYAYDALGGKKINPKEMVETLFTSLMDAYNPIGGTDLLSAVTPTILDIPVEIARNKQWSGSKIRPDSNPNAPKDVQYFQSLKETQTGKAEIAGTKALQQYTGIAISPADVDYAFRQIIGGAGRSITKLSNTIIGTAVGDPPPPDEFPFLSRFYRIRTEEEVGAGTSEGEKLRGLLEKGARESFYQKEDAENTFRTLKAMPKNEAASQFEKIKKDDPALAKKILEIAKDDKKGLTYTDRKIKQLGVANGERAKYLYEKFNNLDTDTEKRQLWEEYTKKGLITKEVSAQLLYLLKQNPKEPDELIKKLRSLAS